jgi:hypothetical protein
VLCGLELDCDGPLCLTLAVLLLRVFLVASRRAAGSEYLKLAVQTKMPCARPLYIPGKDRL